MKLVFFSDYHITRSSELSRPTEDGLNEYLQICLQSASFVRDVCRQERPDVLVFGGDFWDSTEFIDAASLHVGVKIWRELGRIDVPNKFALVGNHDYYAIQHQIYSLDLARLAGWTVVDEVRAVQGLGFLPYRVQYTDAEIDTVRNCSVVLAHSDVIGGQFYASEEAATCKSGIDSHSIRSFVLNGHFHHPLQVSPNWVNVGSLTTRTFKDKGSRGGLAVYDVETSTFKRLVNPYAKRFLDVHILSEEDGLDDDLQDACVRVYYKSHLEEYAQVVADLAETARLIPLVESSTLPTAAAPTDFSLSFEDNLVRYVREYTPQLEDIALSIFREAIEQYTEASQRVSLKFTRLRIENYLCIHEADIDLSRPGVVFVGGLNDYDVEQESNGAGKSTILDAIYWCLKGKSLKELRGNELISWDRDYCSVSLDIEPNYTVIRTRKHPEYKSGVRIFEDGKDISARLPGSTNDMLDALVGRSEVSLRHVCFMLSDDSHKFTSLGYVKRARLLEEIVDSRPYQIALDIAKSRLEDFSSTAYSLRGERARLEERERSCSDRMTELQRELDTFDDTSKQMKLQTEARIAQLEKKIEGVEKVRDELRSSIQELQQEEETVEEKIRLYYEHVLGVAGELNLVESELSVAEFEVNQLLPLEGRQLCPLCKNEVDEAEVRGKLAKLNSKRTTLRNEVTTVRDLKHTADERMRKLKSSLSAKKSLRENKQTELRGLKNSDRDWKYQLESSKSELASVDAGRSRLSAMYEERERQLSEIKEELEDVLARYASAQNALQSHKELVDIVFSEYGVRNAFLAQVVIPYINSRIPRYSQKIWPGKIISVVGYRELKGGALNNEIDVLIDDCSYKAASSGQRRRIDLIIQFALNDLANAVGSGSVEFLGIDEILDHLDDVGISRVREVLDEKAESSTILMISHSKHAAAISDRKLVAHKLPDGYTVVEKQ